MHRYATRAYSEEERAALTLFFLERNWRALGIAPDPAHRFPEPPPGSLAASGGALEGADPVGSVRCGAPRRCRACGTVNRDSVVRVRPALARAWGGWCLVRSWRSGCTCFGVGG